MKEGFCKKGLEPGMVDVILRELKDKKLLSDRVLAQNLAESRVKARLLGNERIESDLVRKGIPPDMAKAAVKEMAQSEDAHPEEDRAFKLILRRAKQISAKDVKTIERKLFGYLARRGFDPDTIERALHRYWKRDGLNCKI